MGTMSNVPRPSTSTVAPAPEPEATVGVNEQAARVFSTSILISAVRCLLTYVLFPWVMPLLGLAGNVGPVVGITIGLVAIGFNIASIRRFWVTEHRMRGLIAVINGSVIVLLLILIARDLGDLFS